MEDAIKEVDMIETALKEYKVTDALIEKLVDDYKDLTIAGIEDKQGYTLVKKARQDVKNIRVDVEKTRKGLNSDALKFTTAVNAEAKRITAMLKPTEDRLHAEEKAVDDKRLQIKNAEAEAKRKKVEDRIQLLHDAGAVFNGMVYTYQTMGSFISGIRDGETIEITGKEISEIEDDVFASALDRIAYLKELDAKKQVEIDQQKEAEAEKQRKITEEQERVRIEQEKKADELKAEQDRIDAEKKVIADAKQKDEDDKKRKAELEKAEKDAADKALKEKAEQEEKEAKEKAEADRVAKLEADLAEKMKPDNEKLIALSNTIQALTFPVLENDSSWKILTKAKEHLQKACRVLEERNDDI